MAKRTKKIVTEATNVKRCSAKYCRNPATMGSFCEKHFNQNDAVEQVAKLTEMEALKFGKMDAEIRNCLQGIQLAEYEINRIRQEAQAKMEFQQASRNKLTDRLTGLRRDYEPLVRELAEKYGITDPAKMSIDPDSGIIRDLSESTKD